MKNTVFKGMATAIVTPMTENGIDYEALGRFIEFQIENDLDQRKYKYKFYLLLWMLLWHFGLIC